MDSRAGGVKRNLAGGERRSDGSGVDGLLATRLERLLKVV